MNAVAYYRYSSHGQRETSIEGQRKEVQEYAQRNGYTIIKEYIDRALTGTNDKRPQFQRILADSEKQKFELVIVYSLDRFARNRYESAFNKAHLKKYGVRVVSATENITDDPAGIMFEGILEASAEYYSAELSQKVRRGIRISIENCKHLGSKPPFGYVVDEDKHYQIDSSTAPVVQKIFELYAAGFSLKKINEAIIEKFGKSYFGNINNSINKILDNRNYLGVYTRGGAEVIRRYAGHCR
jgi:DNA invertase Pin-like site-specific DNA recombinase